MEDYKKSLDVIQPDIPRFSPFLWCLQSFSPR